MNSKIKSNNKNIFFIKCIKHEILLYQFFVIFLIMNLTTYCYEITLKVNKCTTEKQISDLYYNGISKNGNTWTLTWNNKVNSITFKSKDFIEEIDFTNFDSSSITNMEYFFEKCNSLTSINFRHFDTSSVVEMKNMFSECSSLKSLDLSSFDTSKVTNMGHLFNGCSSLTSVNLSSFNTLNTRFMDNMFKNCISLSSLDLSSFNTEKVEKFESMFENCINLKEINFKNIIVNNNATVDNAFKNMKQTIEICIDEDSKLLKSVNSNDNDCAIFIS